MTRLMGVVAAMALAGAACAQDLAQKVTYTTVAVPIDRALHEIAAIANVKLEAATDVQGEVVIVSVHDAVLNDLMQRIAAATSCRWKKNEDGSYRLFRPSEIATAEEMQEAAARLAAVRKAVDKLNEPLRKNPVLDAKAADDILKNQTDPGLGALAGAGGNIAGAVKRRKSLLTGGADQPTGRAAARLLAQLDLTTISNMEEGERIVFSTRPNAMQLPLGPDAGDVLNTLVAEQGVWAEAYQRKTEGETKTDVEKATRAAMHNVMGVFNGPIEGKPVKALLCVQLQSLLGAYQLRLKLYDAQGKEVFQGGQTMAVASSPLNRIDDLLKAQPPSDDPEIEFSDDSKALLVFFRGMLQSVMGGGSAAKDLTPEVLAKLRNPDKYDPLGFIQSEALIAVAGASKANLVADVPDSLMGMAAGMMPGQKLTVDRFLKALGAGDSVALETKDGWMVLKPTRPVLERMKHVDRAALTRLIAVAQAKRMVPLDDLAAYAVANGPLMGNDVSRLYSLLFVPGAALGMTGMGGMSNWDMLRFYGSLTADQRQALGGGNQIAMRTLLPGQVDLVKRMTYYPSGLMGSTLKVQQPGSQPATPALPPGFGGADIEPTEVLPNGLPPNGFVEVKVKTDSVVQDAGATQPRIQLIGTYGPQELGVFRVMKNDPTMGAMLSSFLPQLQSFRLGNRTTYDFNFQYTPEVSMGQQLQDSQIDPDGPILSFADLPEDFQKQAQAMEDGMKKAGGFPNIFGGAAPPKP